MATAKQSPMLLYLIMMLGLVVGFLYNSQADPASEVTPVPANFQLISLKGLENLRIDYTALQSEAFRSLRTYGELPVQAGSGGKTNPFQ